MDLGLRDKVAIVTGSSDGIGLVDGAGLGTGRGARGSLRDGARPSSSTLGI